MKKVLLVVIVGALMASLAIAGERVVYPVKKGDTLDQLMYVWKQRQGVQIEKLFIWNPDLGTQIKVGQEIVYFLPDRPETNLPEQEVKRIVKATIEQINLANIPAVAPKVEKSLRNRALNLLGLCLGIAVAAVALLFLGAMLYRMNRKPKKEKQVATAKPDLEKYPKTHLATEPIIVTIKGHEYDFYPEMAEDGRFKTFYVIEPAKRAKFFGLFDGENAPARFMFVATEKKLKESLRTSFREDQTLVKRLLDEGRLRMKLPV